MDIPKNSKPTRIGQVVGATAVAIGGTIASVYALNRLRRHRKTQALLDTLPPSTDVGIEDQTAEPDDDVYDPAQVSDGHAETAALEDMTYEELYRLAQDRDVAGRSSMRKAELIEALRDSDHD